MTEQWLKLRQQAEQEIVRATIEAAIKRGFKLWGAIHGEDDFDDDGWKTSSIDEVMEHAFECDETHIYFTAPDGSHPWLYVVLGNTGWDVIADYVTTLDDAVKDTDKLVEQWEAKLS